MNSLIPPHEAFARVQSAWQFQEIEAVSSLLAARRILAEDIRCDRDQPPFHRVMMDGYAFHTSLLANAKPLEVTAIQGAGELPSTTDGVVEIMTGAALPAHCNAVMPYEKSERNGNTVTFVSEEITPFMNVHQQGFDKRAGDILLRAGEELRVSDVATLFAVGKAEVKVNKRLSFCIISTGNELVSVNETPAAHQIRSSNKEMLHALLSPYAASIELRHLPDEREALKDFLHGESLRYDVLCFSGGVSMGKYDYVASELENAHVQSLFHGVQQRPGKPFFFGTRDAQLIYAFPGNPVSVLHCATRFLLPFLSQQERLTRVLNAPITNKTKLYFYKPVSQLPNGQVHVIEQHGSGDFMGLHGATGFVELAPEGHYEAGSELPYFAFH
jgi:molybdopterin molybdotransferase